MSDPRPSVGPPTFPISDTYYEVLCFLWHHCGGRLALTFNVLRITTQESGEAVRFLLEGKLGGPWVGEMERAFGDRKGKLIVVDLGGLTGTDAAGRKLIAHMQCQGAALQNPGPILT